MKRPERLLLSRAFLCNFAVTCCSKAWPHDPMQQLHSKQMLPTKRLQMDTDAMLLLARDLFWGNIRRICPIFNLVFIRKACVRVQGLKGRHEPHCMWVQCA